MLNKALFARNNIVFITLLCIHLPTSTINIVFDLGGVLFDTNSLAVLQNIGLRNCIMYAVTHPQTLPTFSQHMRKRLFAFLDNALPRNTDECMARDESGMLMPQIMCNWLKGSTTNNKILEYLTNISSQHPGYFDSRTEKDIIMATVTTMFTPQQLASTRKLIPEMVAFARTCHRQGHKLYIVSNWDSESFAHIKNLYPKFFSLFSGIVISGNCHSLKPSPEPFKKLLDTYQLNPAECFFIDDRPENCATAQELGFSTYVYTRKPAWYIWPTNTQEIIQKQLAQLIVITAHHHHEAIA